MGFWNGRGDTNIHTIEREREQISKDIFDEQDIALSNKFESSLSTRHSTDAKSLFISTNFLSHGLRCIPRGDYSTQGLVIVSFRGCPGIRVKFNQNFINVYDIFQICGTDQFRKNCANYSDVKFFLVNILMRSSPTLLQIVTFTDKLIEFSNTKWLVVDNHGGNRCLNNLKLFYKIFLLKSWSTRSQPNIGSVNTPFG